ncbi:MAG: ABC transporter [Shewanellaceae bacterium]|nr:ABC transporter [Shewanellaceae bacterium]
MRFGSIICLLIYLIGCQPANLQKYKYLYQFRGEQVKPGQALNFPTDHGEHIKQGLEWWYLTANLTDESGQTFGAQWTLFRVLSKKPIDSIWWNNQLYIGHFALETNNEHVAFEYFARAQQAYVQNNPFQARINNWVLQSKSSSFLPLSLKAQAKDMAIDLELKDSPRVLHGENGYSQKTPEGQASYYYSYPLLKAKGQLTWRNKTYQVKGMAWFDREWSGGLLNPKYRGWDWFSIQKENNQGALMIFCMRNMEQQYKFCRGTDIKADGTSTSLKNSAIDLHPLKTVSIEGRDYPIKWDLVINHTTEIEIDAVNQNSLNNLFLPYWEGRIEAKGSFQGQGYVELTGY